MEFVSNVSLKTFIKNTSQKKLDETTAKKVFSQIASAVAYCHSKNISHRDIKLENILIQNDLQIKIIDFGFSI